MSPKIYLTFFLLLACRAPDAPVPPANTGTTPPADTATTGGGTVDTGDGTTGDTTPTDTAPPADTAPPVDTGDTTTVEDPDRAPDFALVDLDPGSPRFGETISPRDYLEQVSGWYFIHST